MAVQRALRPRGHVPQRKLAALVAADEDVPRLVKGARRHLGQACRRRVVHAQALHACGVPQPQCVVEGCAKNAKVPLPNYPALHERIALAAQRSRRTMRLCTAKGWPLPRRAVDECRAHQAAAACIQAAHSTVVPATRDVVRQLPVDAPEGDAGLGHGHEVRVGGACVQRDRTLPRETLGRDHVAGAGGVQRQEAVLVPRDDLQPVDRRFAPVADPTHATGRCPGEARTCCASAS